MCDSGPRVSEVREPSDVRVFETSGEPVAPRERTLDQIACEQPFQPHPGWAGHIERNAS